MLESIQNMTEKYYMNTFGKRTDACFVKGKGNTLYDTEGKKYHDFFAGIAVSSLGYHHKKVISAAKKALCSPLHTSNLYYIQSQAKLAAVICQNSCADKVFFANSGAEANEGAMKLALMYFYKKGTPKSEFISLTNSFHGRTLMTVALTGQEKYKAPYGSVLPAFKHAPINDIGAVKGLITDKTCAIFIEGIQGESGVNLCSLEFVAGIRKLCDENGILLIFDEVQTGMGRTGKLFCYEHFGVTPDIFTLAKGLGGGVPIGAVCAKDFVAEAFSPGDHGSTFGGNPFACAVSEAVFTTMIKDNVAENAAKAGQYLINGLLKLQNEYPDLIKEVRGKGLMIGIEFRKPIAVQLKNNLFDRGFLVGSAGDSVTRLLPPLVITHKDIEKFLEELEIQLLK